MTEDKSERPAPDAPADRDRAASPAPRQETAQPDGAAAEAIDRATAAVGQDDGKR